jgi:heptosyltransferase-2
MPTWLGDTIMAVPTVRALGRAVPHLVLWGPEANGRLLLATGVQAKLLPYSRRPGPLGLIDIQAGIRSLRGLRATGVVLLPNAYEPALIAKLAGIRRRIGYATQLRGNLLTEALPAPDPLSATHEARLYSDLLKPTPAQPPLHDDWRLAAPPDSAGRVEALIPGNQPLLALVPGSANGPAKRWPAAHYARVAEFAEREWGALPVLLGGREDGTATAAVANASSAECLDLAGKTDLLDLAAILASSRAVITNDTGAAHLAGALGARTLVLFGPTDPLRTKPLGPHVRVASVATFCQPCMSPECPLDHRCMTGLTPDLAISMLTPLWSSAR